MGERNALCLLIVSTSLCSVTCVFFHEPSAVLLKPSGETNPKSDFGFAMGYWNEDLIVGSPRSSLFGNVYRCPIAGISNDKNISCIDLKINSTKYSLDLNPEQNFYLGASIATTKEYFFTCAPLVTKKIQRPMSKIRNDAFGSCFLYLKNGTVYQYKGPDDRFLLNEDNKVERFEGGTGWTTLADEDNGFLIIAKTSVVGDINYLPISDPLKTPYSVTATSGVSATKLRDYWDIGYGLTAGTFFSKQTVYALSMQSRKMSGEIVFLSKNRKDYLTVMHKNKNAYRITNKVIGGMFGYSLRAADLNLDGLSELLVGAPAQSDDGSEVEYGALHIYLGGDIESCDDKSRMRTIFGRKEKGRFGTAIAASDVDGDSIPEIFVSAPYEESGVVYVLSGYELNRTVIRAVGFKQVLVTELRHTQQVRRSELRLLGFSLQPLPDIDGNGCNDLAIGAPGSASVLLFRCLQAVNVTVTSKLNGLQNVRELDTHFTVDVCLQVGFRSKSANVTGSISVKNDIIGAGVYIKDPNFNMDLSLKKENFCKTITVEMKDHEQAEYSLVTQVELENINTALESKDFDQFWVVLSPYSVTRNELEVVRRCSGDSCYPQLSMKILWTGAKEYEVGSSEAETVSIVVKNDGYAAYGACLVVGASGAQVARAECRPAAGGYTCLLPKPLRRTAEHIVTMVLNMTQLLSQDKKLTVIARLYENCNQENFTTEKLEVHYSFEKARKDVHLAGVKHDLQITDKEIADNEIKIFKDYHEYLITNNGSVVWKDIKAIIIVENRPFINKVDTTERDNCEVVDDIYQHKITCFLTLLPGASKKIIAISEMSKTEVGKFLNGGRQMNITSEMQIFLETSNYTEKEGLVTQIKLKNDISFGNNKFLIILVATILAVLFLALITYVLYKNGFFKRKQKKRLDVLRESVRRRSIRLASEKSSKPSHKTPSSVDDEHLDIEVMDDVVFDEIPAGAKDDVVLIESEAEIHKDESKNSSK